MIPAETITRSPWLWDVKPFCIADNLYYVGNKSVSSHLIDTGEGLLLLDTGYSQAAYLLLESIRELGFAPGDIKWILHTHGHFDHFGATRMLVEKYGCKTYFPEIDLPFLSEKAEFNWCREAGQSYEPPYDIYFAPDHLVKPGDVLTFGNTKVEFFDGGGHTPGTLAIRFTLPSGLKAAMHGGVGINTMSSKYAKEKNIGTTWREAYIRNLRNLYDLEVDIVLGNHPEQSDTFEKMQQMGGENNPFINPEEWNSFLKKREAIYLRVLEKDPM